MKGKAPTYQPVVLVVLDGWGIGRAEPGNAVLAANTPTMDRLWEEYPHATLRCSGEEVGLPAGQMGNSEVGHLNLGAGFVVYQWLTRIDRAIADGSFSQNPALLAAIHHAQKTCGALHLLGLVSDGGVHSHILHLVALLRLARDHGLDRVAVHAFTDGRDTAPLGGLGYLMELERAMTELGVGRIVSVAGRYYAMDRDHRWDRTQQSYDAIVRGQGERVASAAIAMTRAYDTGVTDEFVTPIVIAPTGEEPTMLEAGDSVIFFNFRADRARQLTEALVSPTLTGFNRGAPVPDLFVATMTRYEATLPVAVAFAPRDIVNPVARAVADAGLPQFHCAETEKYAHVTYFFNGGQEAPFAGEERVLIPSPKIATYDLQPEMSASEVTAATVAAIESGHFPFIIVNFANADMVGHTGVFAAAVRAVEAVDRGLARIVGATLAAGGVTLVTADHGNAEEMIDRATGRPMTAHTTNPVPVVLVTPEHHPLRHARLRQDGRLCAVAPTLLGLLGVRIPADMSEPRLDLTIAAD